MSCCNKVDNHVYEVEFVANWLNGYSSLDHKAGVKGHKCELITLILSRKDKKSCYIINTHTTCSHHENT